MKLINNNFVYKKKNTFLRLPAFTMSSFPISSFNCHKPKNNRYSCTYQTPFHLIFHSVSVKALMRLITIILSNSMIFRKASYDAIRCLLTAKLSLKYSASPSARCPGTLQLCKDILILVCTYVGVYLQ